MDECKPCATKNNIFHKENPLKPGYKHFSLILHFSFLYLEEFLIKKITHSKVLQKYQDSFHIELCNISSEL